LTQFEVVFSDDPIAESDALSLVESAHPTYDAGLASQTDLTSQIRESASADTAYNSPNPDSDPSADTILSHTYNLVTLPPQSYLCSIPAIAPPLPPNQTAAALARTEEARERDRASASGWSIIHSSLDGNCLYYMSGWWSYSFCYDQEIVQFHALPAGTHKGGVPPVRDPQSAEYVLGRVHYDQHDPNHHHHHRDERDGGQDDVVGRDGDAPAPGTELAPPNSELAVKDNQRYLVQRLDGGTLCDLTGRERTIEVQYHCHPGIPGERIGWIKEVTTCTYLMVVQTPRLCSDVAFLPPKEARAHPITCRPVGGSHSDGQSWLGIKGKEAGEGIAAAAGQAAEVLLSAAGAGKDKDKGASAAAAPVTIGGVVIGGRKMLGTGADGAPAARLPSPRHLAGARPGSGAAAGAVVEILAKGSSKAEGGKVEVLTREQLEKLDLSAEAIEELRKELQKMAGDNGWKLEVIEVPGENAEIRGIVEGADDDEEEDAATAAGAGGKKQAAGGKRQNDKVFKAETAKKTKKKEGEGKEQGRKHAKDDRGEDDEGSEEVFYRDEL
jgi:protein OS-9